jgi:uncharacterized protein involved in exopolysaccharide biosynthesis
MTEQIKLSDISNLFRKFISYALTKFRIFAIITFISCIISTLYWFSQDAKYTAVATFIVEEGTSKSGGLSGIASQFGIDIGSIMGGGGASLFSGDNIFEIMKSRKIITKVLLTKDENGKTLADLYVEMYGMKHSKDFKFQDSLNTENYLSDNKKKIFQDSILNIIYKNILLKNLLVEKLNKKSSVITVSVLSPDEKFSKIFNERLVKETSNLYIEIKVGNLTKSINKIQQKADSLENVLQNISQESSKLNLPTQEKLLNENTALTLSKENFSSKYTYKNIVPSEYVTRNRTVAFTLYGEVVKNLETLKISLVNQTPIIQVLDLPQFPLNNQKIRLYVTLLFGFFIGILISLGVILFMYTGNKN